jgi:hypothetical protein
MKEKKVIDSIMHFDRFNTDLYREVINTKNGMQYRDYKDEEFEPNRNLGCIMFIIYSMIFLFVLAVLIGVSYVL